MLDRFEHADPRAAIAALREARACDEMVVRLLLDVMPPPPPADARGALLKVLPPQVREAVLLLAGQAADLSAAE